MQLKALNPIILHSLQWTFNKAVLLCMHVCSHSGLAHPLCLYCHLYIHALISKHCTSLEANPSICALFLFSLRKVCSLNKLSNCLGLFLLESALEPHFPRFKYWVAGQKPTPFSATPGGVLPYFYIDWSRSGSTGHCKGWSQTVGVVHMKLHQSPMALMLHLFSEKTAASKYHHCFFHQKD